MINDYLYNFWYSWLKSQSTNFLNWKKCMSTIWFSWYQIVVRTINDNSKKKVSYKKWI